MSQVIPNNDAPTKSKRTAMFISFSGIDGAGKSTQIANLVEHLELAGRTVRIITFWDDVAMLKGMREGVGHKVFKGDKGVGSPEAPIKRQDKNVRSPLVTFSRLGLYFLDAVSLRRIGSAARHSGSDVVIFDRYLYDELANLNLKNPASRIYLKFLARLVPRPEVSFILDADPDQAFARKPEYPLEFLHLNRKAYLDLGNLLGTMTVVPPSSIEQAKAFVVDHVVTHPFAILS